MRTLVFAISALVATAAAAASPSLDLGDPDTARPGGVYTTLTVADAAACVRLCAQDSLCMAWTLRASGACELKAVITPRVAEYGARSGLSARAPAFARTIADTRPALAPEIEAPPALALRMASSAPPASTNDELLGGDDTEDLRPRIGARR